MTAVELSQREIAQRLLALRVVMDRIKVEDRRLRELAAASLKTGERVGGYLDEDDEETKLGFVQVRKGSARASVVDEAAFLEWVRAVAPGEIVTRESVRESFTRAVLEDVKAHGGWISHADGELHDPDGVSVSVGAPTLAVSPLAEADALIADALAGGRLQLMPGEPS